MDSRLSLEALEAMVAEAHRAAEERAAEKERTRS
jgi:hypothetical protein